MQLSASDNPDTIFTRATTLLSSGARDEALELLGEARTIFPKHAGIAGRYSDALHLTGRLDEAVRAYELALQLDATAPQSWYGLGCLHLARWEYGAAARALKRAVMLAPDAGLPNQNLAEALYQLGHVDAAIDRFQRACRAGIPGLAEVALSNIACIVPGSDTADNAAVLRSRQDWAKLEMKKISPSWRRQYARPVEVRKLRVGYLSAFFGARNWMKPVWALINAHDRERFDIHMFSDGDSPSADGGYRNHPDDHVHAIRGLSNEQAARVIADAEIDVLVDLNGYSYQRRLPLLMLHPTPVIVGWFNMFATTGIGAVDWLVGDNAVIPSSEEPYYVERIYRLPSTYLAFNVLYPVPEVAPPPSLSHGASIGHITFGCLGSQYKFTDGVLGAWARILKGAPTSELFLKNGALGDASTRADLLDRLASRGVNPARVALEGHAEHFDFLRAYERIDIALDTFPYNGGTTTMEALWQGVPVLAFNGDRWAARTSRSLLMAAGLQDWVLSNAEAYVQHAIALANDPTTPRRLATLRHTLRDQLRASPACDSIGMCRAMEGFYNMVATQIA
jgi:predicted O-linked N-acetylglucosamine transferase (SPINDLY family)